MTDTLRILLTLVAVAVCAPAPCTARANALLPTSLEASGAFTNEELQALDLALWAVAMTRGDLGFDKTVADAGFLLPIVTHLLNHPLDNPGYASAFAAAWPGATKPAAALRLLLEQLAMPGEEPAVTSAGIDMEPEPETGDPGGLITSVSTTAGPPLPGSPERRFLDSLPDHIDRALRLFIRQLPLLRDSFAQAFSAFSLEQRELLACLTLTLAADEDVTAPLPAGRCADTLESIADPIAVFLELAELVDWPCLTAAIEESANLYTEMRDLLCNPAAGAQRPPWDSIHELTTTFGLIAVGTAGDDHYANPCILIIDPGGNDIYEGNHATACGCGGSPVGMLFDLGGDDMYRSAGDFSQAAAMMGAAFLYDAEGDDIYRARWLAQGAAMFGAAWLEDAAGTDDYYARGYAQGAGIFGAGALVDEQPETDRREGEGNDSYRAGLFAQAFSRTRGAGILEDRYGNDHYQAGGCFMHRPLYDNRYQSLSQGFSIGIRPAGGGGIAFLMDHDGNDRYGGEVYGQGAGYWYGAGFLLDDGGNDGYTLTIYGQGSGIHLACGTLIDAAGDDSYLMNDGLGQGGAHDFAAGVLMDHAGNDQYIAGNASNQGTGLTNAVGIFLDRAGNDLYASLEGMANGAGRPARGYGSIGVFADLDGKDRYTLAGADDTRWTQTTYGSGVDIHQDRTSMPVNPPPHTSSPAAALPVIDGKLDREEFDALWSIACEWAVGINRDRVPAARQTVAAQGLRTLRFVEPLLGTADSLEIQAIETVLTQMIDQHRKPILKILRHALQSEDDITRNNALSFTAELHLQELAPLVIALLDDHHSATHAIRAAGEMRLEKAAEQLVQFLDCDQDRQIALAVEALCRLGSPETMPRLTALLDHDSVVVRMSVIESLGRLDIAAEELIRTAAGSDRTERARRNALLTLARMQPDVLTGRLDRLIPLLDDPAWAIRGGTVELLDGLHEDGDVRTAVSRAAALEKDTYVLAAIKRFFSAEPARIP
ncbi:HEAT repeat domain-containing protein [bacterium]|nr:HEAT repeat domain-containing protein [candidate division CSSED10-310 bacterium]